MNRILTLKIFDTAIQFFHIFNKAVEESALLAPNIKNRPATMPYRNVKVAVVV